MPRLTLSLLLWVWTGIPLASALRCSPVAAALLHHRLTCHDRRAPAAVCAPRGGWSGYERGDDGGGPIDEKRVEALLCEREDLRYERRYREADAVRDELASLGVTVWDRDKLWVFGDDARAPRRDGGRDGLDRFKRSREKARGNNFYRSNQRSAARSNWFDEPDPYSRDSRPRTKSRVRELNEFGHDYSRSEDDESTVTALQMEQINDMLRLRLEAKLAKDYREADMLLEELRQSFGVDVNDGAKAWRADGRSFERVYKRAGGRGGDVDERTVAALIKKRTAARKVKDFRAADAILSELLEVHGVVLVDHEYTWRFVGGAHDGGYGEGGGYGRRRAPSATQDGHDYVRDRNDRSPIPAADLAQIDRLLGIRLAKKKGRDFAAADRLQEKLRDLGVEVDDRRRTWYIARPNEDDGNRRGYQSPYQRDEMWMD